MSILKKYWLIIVSIILFAITFLFLLYIALMGTFGISNDILVVLLTAIIGGFGWIFKSEYDKGREIDRREFEARMDQERLTFETRREAYEDILNFFIDAIVSHGSSLNVADLREHIVRAGFKLNIYGSDEVIKAYTNFRQLGGQTSPNSMALIVEFARLVIKIRKSTGFPDSNLTVEQVLRSFIIDYDNHSAEIQSYIAEHPMN